MMSPFHDPQASGQPAPNRCTGSSCMWGFWRQFSKHTDKLTGQRRVHALPAAPLGPSWLALSAVGRSLLAFSAGQHAMIGSRATSQREQVHKSAAQNPLTCWLAWLSLHLSARARSASVLSSLLICINSLKIPLQLAGKQLWRHMVSVWQAMHPGCHCLKKATS